MAKRLRLPRQKANDGKVLVSVDLTEINHKPLPVRSSAGPHSVIAGLKARIETLQTELAKVETAAAGHRVDFEQERHRTEQLMSEMFGAIEDAMTAREKTARLEGELATLRSRPWWQRVAG